MQLREARSLKKDDRVIEDGVATENLCGPDNAILLMRMSLCQSCRRRGIQSHNLGAAEVGAPKALKDTRAVSLCSFQCCGVPDICQSCLHLSLLSRRVLSKAVQAPASQVDLVSPDCVPRRLGRKVGSNEERNWPHPLQHKRKSPAKVTLYAASHCSDYTGGQ